MHGNSITKPVTIPFSEMEWPKFDFAMDSQFQSHRLSSRVKWACGMRKRRSKTCSLAVNFENIKSGRRSSEKLNTVQKGNVTLHQQILRNSSPPACSSPFQMKRSLSTARVPPLSPILVSGFLENPIAKSPMLLRDPNLNADKMLILSRHINPVNLLAASICQCNDTINNESSELLFTAPNSAQSFLSGPNSASLMQGSAVASRNGTSASQPKSNTFVTSVKECDNSNSKTRKNPKKAHKCPKLHESRPAAGSASVYLGGSWETSFEVLPSGIDCKRSFPEIDFMNSQFTINSNKSITVRKTPIDVSQSHTVCVDDCGSICSTGEQSTDCFLDVTIHEIQPSDPDFNNELFVQSTSPSEANQLSICNFQDGNDEIPHQKQYYRLSKLAETLKKRLFISSSDLVMWKCEDLKQNPVEQVTVVSNVVQWGFCWTLAKNISDSKIIHIVDSEPMKRTTDVHFKDKNKAKRNSGDKESRRCNNSEHQTSEETFSLYQPISKLTTSSGEFILSPRYYRFQYL